MIYPFLFIYAIMVMKHRLGGASMSKITCYIAMTLDGFIADEYGSVSFLDDVNNIGDDFGYTDFYKSVDAVMMGSKTYEQVLSFGGYPYSNKKSFVLTSRKDELEAKTSFQDTIEFPIEFYTGNIGDIIQALREERRYQHLWLIGGSDLIRQMIEEGILDELRLTIIPKLLGKGIPLFNHVNTFQFFSLIGTKTYSKGVLELHYDLRR